MAYPDSNGFSPTALKEACILSMAPVLQYTHPWPHFVPTLTANCASPFFSNSLVLEIPAAQELWCELSWRRDYTTFNNPQGGYGFPAAAPQPSPSSEGSGTRSATSPGSS